MNTTYTAVLVDDESHSREVLAKLLNTYFPEIEVAGEAADVEEAYELIINKNPQIVFLDIQMPRANGFNLLHKFEAVPFEVIFVTSYDQYAINAIRFNAIDYILKPVEIEDLQRALSRAKLKLVAHKDSSVQIINLLYSLYNHTAEKKISVHSGEKVKVLNASEILYIEARGRYSKISLSDGEQYTIAKIIKDFEDYFGDQSSFVRISKSVLINANHIKKYSKREPFTIEMANDSSFELPRRKKTEILQKLSTR